MMHAGTIETLRALEHGLESGPDGLRTSLEQRLALLALVEQALEDGGPISQGDLAKQVGISRSGMTGIIDRFVGAGLTERVHDHDRRDRRKAYIIPTDRAVELVRGAEPTT